MSTLDVFKNHLRPGHVYRRADVAQWSRAVDRHLQQLLAEGVLQKLSAGLYYYPEKSKFGVVPADEEALVAGFLKDTCFLIHSPNAYHTLGLGTSQLYNETIVYNHKRHGRFKLGQRYFDFRCKPYFPKTITKEFLLVDLVNNQDKLAEDVESLLKKIHQYAVQKTDHRKLKKIVREYGYIRTKKFFRDVIGSDL